MNLPDILINREAIFFSFLVASRSNIYSLYRLLIGFILITLHLFSAAYFKRISEAGDWVAVSWRLLPSTLPGKLQDFSFLLGFLLGEYKKEAHKEGV